MRRVNRPDEFEHAVKLTQGEARNAFGDERLYLERWPRSRATSRCSSSATPTDR